MAAESKVGVRELRQNLSVYLRRVREGEILEVTDRGHAVAMLVPLPSPDTPLERLVALGRVIAPEGDLLELGPPRRALSNRLSDVLEEERSERL